MGAPWCACACGGLPWAAAAAARGPVWKRAGAVQAVGRRALRVDRGVYDRSVVWWLGKVLWVAESGVA